MARNSSFKRAARSASARSDRSCRSSRSSSRSALRRSVMSRAAFEAPITSPCWSRIGDTVSERLILLPLFVMRTVSKVSRRSPFRSFSRINRSSLSRSGGMIIVIDLPIASAAVYSNSRSAAPFHEAITPSSDSLMIASSEDSTIPASRALARSNLASVARCLCSTRWSLTATRQMERRKSIMIALTESAVPKPRSK